MKRFFIWFFLALLAAVLVFFAISMILEFRPEPVAEVPEYFGNKSERFNVLPGTVKIMSWNIGYAGLGDNMDFCVDGGERVRDSRDRTEANLNFIISKLKKECADIYILQEVDLKSHRTYRINELKAIAAAFPSYYVYSAPNFKVWFVPSPLKEPIGKVHSGVVILSRYRPEAVRRIQYPSEFAFPVRMFNLKRCLLEADYRTEDGRIIHIANTHNTAFDTGGMRSVENDFLKERLSEYSAAAERFIVVGDWNQCPPQYTPSADELENEFFSPQLFDTTGINSFAKVVCDTTCKTMRYNDKPYSDSSTTSLLDFFLISRDGVESVEMHTVDMKFRASDHNPVIMKLKL